MARTSAVKAASWRGEIFLVENMESPVLNASSLGGEKAKIARMAMYNKQ